MKRTIVMTCAVCAAGLLASRLAAQEPVPPARFQATVDMLAQAIGSTRIALETRVTRGKPYSGEAVTEFVQVLGDGNRIVRKTSERLFRDGEGRTRREPTDSDSERSSIVINDPVAGTSFILNAGTHTATKSPTTFARVEGSGYTITRGGGEPKVEVITIPDVEVRRTVEATAQVAGAGARGGATIAVGGPRGGSLLASAGQTSKEDLGQQQVDSVTANGTRTTTVIPAGTIGNEQPITIVSEQWFSTDLDVLVLTRHSDPRVGETTYRLTNISRSEPDRSLFQVPSDYTIQERRPPVMRRQQQQQQ